MLSPIDQRIQMFAELHRNKWFMVFNWVLDSMRIKDRAQLINHIKYAQTFY